MKQIFVEKVDPYKIFSLISDGDNEKNCLLEKSSMSIDTYFLNEKSKSKYISWFNKLNKVSKKHKTMGPVVLIITSSAIRAVNLRRELKNIFKKYGMDINIAKLFGKHIKLEDQMSYLNKNLKPIHMAIGTPGRLRKILEMDNSIKLDCLRRVVVDWSWHDSKLRTIYHMQEDQESEDGLSIIHSWMPESSNIRETMSDEDSGWRVATETSDGSEGLEGS
ncbi:unnamed protein product [Gordionus sp. m RMFG-2023]